jgi:IclR family pca regulon transcriptional regulator
MTRPDRASNHDSYMAPSLERGLRLLSVLASARTELSLSELAERLELSRSSVFRLCYTLDQLGFVRRTRLGYEMGPRVLTLGFDYLSSLDLVDTARPELVALRDDTGASAHLGVLHGRDVIYIAQVAAQRQLASRVAVGSHFPAHAMSMGRLLLSALSDEEFDALYKGVSLEKFTTPPQPSRSCARGSPPTASAAMSSAAAASSVGSQRWRRRCSMRTAR